MTDLPIRIRRQRIKGWRLPPDTVIVDRTSKWGNPFRIGGVWRCECENYFMEFTVRDRTDATARFREMTGYFPRPYPTNNEIKAALRGKNLACWCPLDQPCHADVLLEIANG